MQSPYRTMDTPTIFKRPSRLVTMLAILVLCTLMGGVVGHVLVKYTMQPAHVCLDQVMPIKDQVPVPMSCTHPSQQLKVTDTYMVCQCRDH